MEYHGDEDVMEITKRDMELALEVVVETILDCSMWPKPQKGKFTQSKFDLYDFLSEERDPSYAMEMYVASMSSNTRAFEDRIERERKTVEAMLVKHLTGSDLVADLAAEYAEENK
jgi:hypothetical protein